jgi:hypothetical protein
MSQTETRPWVAFLAVFLLFAWCYPQPGGSLAPPSPSAGQEPEQPRVFRGGTVTVVVPGNVAWTDTGLEVAAGQEIIFLASGKISLQKGNPQADCGPDGYDLRTVQQPLPDRNLGALIGKVVIAVTVIIDEKTGEERREEAAQVFYVGLENRVPMPAKGRLFLGINENVSGDNAGEFIVTVTAPEE